MILADKTDGGLRQALSKWEIVLYAGLLWFSAWIMFQTFSYDYQKGVIAVGYKILSDFSANLPLIRSFSLGENWPPEYPIFPGEPIRYHFLFFYLVGQLEKLGLPIHWALNIPSALGFFAMLAMIYALGKKLFSDVRIALLGLAFFIFNGSLSFLQFFEKHPLSASSIKDIVTTLDYSAMGPWDGGKVLGVWHLNVFVNQRHFCVALGLLLVFMYTCHSFENRGRKTHLITAAIFGIAVGFLPLFHKPVMLMFAVAMTVYFLAFPYLRMFLLVMGAVSLSVMGLLWFTALGVAGSADTGAIHWYPGFTMHDANSTVEVLSFFWYQFGLHCILAPIGLVLAPWRAKVFMLPALLVFAIGFLFRFSVDILANHKFLNFGLIIAGMLSAYALIRTYDYIVRPRTSSNTVRRIRTGAAMISAAAVVVFMTFSGFIDIFALVNERVIHIPDVRSNPAARWFYENTPKDAVVLNSNYFSHPASIAGRKIYFGWAYFTVSAGYASGERFEIVKEIYAGDNPKIFCPLLREQNIGYITVEDNTDVKDNPPINFEYFRRNFKPSFVTSDDKFSIFSTEVLCGPKLAHKEALTNPKMLGVPRTDLENSASTWQPRL